MVRIGGCVEVGLVAGYAGRGSVVVVIVGMALSALHGGMLAGKGIVRVQSMIELGI